MKRMAIYSLIATLLGGCVVAPGYPYRDDAYYRGHGYYDNRGYYHGYDYRYSYPYPYGPYGERAR